MMTRQGLSALWAALRDPRLLLLDARLRFCCRVTAAALLAFALGQLFPIPLHGLWALLTAVLVTQMSVGGSLKATSDYVVGTCIGAVYSGAIAALFPHTSPVSTAVALAVAIAPLAYAAAISPSFRAAPFTAILVLLISGTLGEGPIESAIYRVLEVGLGGVVAIAVSLVLFPGRAHRLGSDAAASVINQIADGLPVLLSAFAKKHDVLEIARIHQQIGKAVDAFQTATEGARHERFIALAAVPDPAIMARTLLRLRHDLVLIGRAATEPLADEIGHRLAPRLTQIGEAAGSFLRASATALNARGAPPPQDAVEKALADYAREMDDIRVAGVLRSLPSSDLERVFTLGLALQQFGQHLTDLSRAIQEWSAR